MKLKLTLLTFTIGCCVSLFSQGIVTTNGNLQVDGNRIENKDGEIFSVAGNSIFWSGFLNDGGKFYRSDVVDHLATDFQSGLVRAAMAVEEADGATAQNKTANFRERLTVNPDGQGYFNNPAREMARIETIIDAAIANDIYVIVDFHSHFAHLFQPQAIQFFTDIATKYGTNDHVIYEIFNEPIGLAGDRVNDSPAFSQFNETWNTIIKPYAIDVIKAIRAIDPDNLIIVGTPGFSQGVEAAANNRITAADLDLPNGTNPNIAYTLHFYAAQPEHVNLRAAATRALNSANGGIALFVTEWGVVEASGTGPINLNETFLWLDFMKENGISHANWSVSDKGGDTSSLVRGGAGVEGLLQNQLTPAGNFIRCMVQNWNADTDYRSCTTESTTSNPNDNFTFPIGIGMKVNAGNSDASSAGIGRQFLGGETILTGIAPGQFIAYTLKDIDISQSYTVQFVISSETAGNTLVIERDAGDTFLGEVAVPNTGDDSYQIVNISGVTFRDDNRTFAIVARGSGTFKLESFYITTDANFTLSVPSFTSELTSKINLYPNPTTDFLTIDSPASVNLSYSIFNIEGKILVPETNYSGRINVSPLSAGFYFIKMNANNESQTFKFVKK